MGRRRRKKQREVHLGSWLFRKEECALTWTNDSAGLRKLRPGSVAKKASRRRSRERKRGAVASVGQRAVGKSTAPLSDLGDCFSICIRPLADHSRLLDLRFRLATLPLALTSSHLVEQYALLHAVQLT